MIYNIKTIRIKLNIKEPQRNASSSGEAEKVLRAIFEGLDADQEHVVLLALDSANHIRGYKVVNSGGQDNAGPDIKVIFRNALLLGATHIIIGHNHPSGQIEPSNEDATFTKKIREAGEVMSLSLLDHIIIGDKGYYSFADRGLL